MSAPEPDLAAVTRERDDWKNIADMQAQIIDASARMEGRLRETLEWVRQTVHRSHHTGPLEECRKNTCDAVSQALARRTA